MLATSQVIHDPWQPPLKPGRNPCCLWNLERNNVPSRSPEGFKQWWTLTKHVVGFGSAGEAWVIIFSSSRTWEGSRMPAQYHCSQRLWAAGSTFSKIPGNPKQLLSQTEPYKMLCPFCRIILGRELGPDLIEMRAKAVSCNDIFTRQLDIYRKLCRRKFLGSNACPALTKQLYIFLDGVRPSAWQNKLPWWHGQRFAFLNWALPAAFCAGMPACLFTPCVRLQGAGCTLLQPAPLVHWAEAIAGKPHLKKRREERLALCQSPQTNRGAPQHVLHWPDYLLCSGENLVIS